MQIGDPAERPGVGAVPHAATAKKKKRKKAVSVAAAAAAEAAAATEARVAREAATAESHGSGVVEGRPLSETGPGGGHEHDLGAAQENALPHEQQQQQKPLRPQRRKDDEKIAAREDLQAELSDLQQKRLLALKSYQQEKALRIKAVSDAEQATAELHATVALLRRKLGEAQDAREAADAAAAAAAAAVAVDADRSAEVGKRELVAADEVATQLADRDGKIARLTEQLRELEAARQADTASESTAAAAGATERSALAEERATAARESAVADAKRTAEDAVRAAVAARDGDRARAAEILQAAERESNARCEELSNARRAAETERDAAVESAAAAARALRDLEAARSADIAGLRDAITQSDNAHKREKETLEDTVKTAEGLCQTQSDRADRLVAEKAALEESVRKVENRVAELEATLASLREDAKVATERRNISEASLAELTVKVENEESLRMSAERRLGEMVETAIALETGLAEARFALEASQSKLLESDADLKEVRTSLNDAMTSHAEVQRRAANSDPSLLLLDQSHAARTQPVGGLAGDLSFLIAELETLGLNTSTNNSSLSWWYQDFAHNPEPGPQLHEEDAAPSEHLTNAAVMRPPVPTSAGAMSSASRQAPPHRHFELEAALAEKTALLDQLAAQLEESSSVCKTLVNTVEEQEATIREMSGAGGSERRKESQAASVS